MAPIMSASASTTISTASPPALTSTAQTAHTTYVSSSAAAQKDASRNQGSSKNLEAVQQAKRLASSSLASPESKRLARRQTTPAALSADSDTDDAAAPVIQISTSSNARVSTVNKESTRRKVATSAAYTPEPQARLLASSSTSTPTLFQRLGQVVDPERLVFLETSFTKADHDLLLVNAHHIRNIPVGNYRKAWLDWAGKNPEHSAEEWAEYCELKILPEYEEKRAESSLRSKDKKIVDATTNSALEGKVQTPAAAQPSAPNHVSPANVPTSRRLQPIVVVESPTAHVKARYGDFSPPSTRPPDDGSPRTKRRKLTADTSESVKNGTQVISPEPQQNLPVIKTETQQASRQLAEALQQNVPGATSKEAVVIDLLDSSSSPSQVRNEVSMAQSTLYPPGAFDVYESNEIPEGDEENVTYDADGLTTTPRRQVREKSREALAPLPLDFRLPSSEQASQEVWHDVDDIDDVDDDDDVNDDDDDETTSEYEDPGTPIKRTAVETADSLEVDQNVDDDAVRLQRQITAEILEQTVSPDSAHIPDDDANLALEDDLAPDDEQANRAVRFVEEEVEPNRENNPERQEVDEAIQQTVDIVVTQTEPVTTIAPPSLPSQDKLMDVRDGAEPDLREEELELQRTHNDIPVTIPVAIADGGHFLADDYASKDEEARLNSTTRAIQQVEAYVNFDMDRDDPDEVEDAELDATSRALLQTQAILESDMVDLDLEIPEPIEDDESIVPGEFVADPLQSRSVSFMPPDTQAILNANTQGLELDVLPPDDSADELESNTQRNGTYEMHSSPPPVPPSIKRIKPHPTTTPQNQPPFSSTNDPSPSSTAATDQFINTQLRLGSPIEDIHFALFRTSLNAKLAARVLYSMRKGRGLPMDMPGVWTEEEDEVLQGGDAAAMRRLEAKKGVMAFEARLELLEKFMSI